MESVTPPELLSPAGNWECARAAIENGADAIYFGIDRFNARMRAGNFTADDLPELMRFLHARGARGYLSFNTLVFTDELPAAEECLRRCIEAGVDAAIVQDVGICRLIRRLSPDFPIHASTQMTVSSAAGVEFARSLGCSLVVLARECSLNEIRALRDEPAGRSMPLEVFVHGALCVAYSGQCLTSEALGGRSANRGECAQACRMPYGLLRDGAPVDLGERRYLLSPQDLAGLQLVPELVRLGIASLKIEGRLKSPEYVANITRLYRRALDRVVGETESASVDAKAERYDMEMAFSRGLHTGWFEGIDNRKLVHARFGKKRGVFLGEVERVDGNLVVARLAGPIKPGDGIVFDAGAPDVEEEGGRVYEVIRTEAEVRLGFGRGSIDFRRVKPGHKIWKTSDPELDRRLRRTFTGSQPLFRRPLHFTVAGRVGERLNLVVRDELGHTVELTSAQELMPAENQPLDETRLRDQFGRLGGTPFRLGKITNRLEGRVLSPLSELNRLRREAVARLEGLRAAPPRWSLSTLRGGEGDSHSPGPRAAECAPCLKSKVAEPFREVSATSPELVVLVRNEAQLEAALGCGVRTLYCDFDDPKGYRSAVKRFRAWFEADEMEADRSSASVWVAPPRITKPGEDWILQQVRSSEPDGFLARNFDHLTYFAASRRIGDYSLNVANALSAQHFIEQIGLEGVTASYDLNNAQLEVLLRASPPEWFEVTIHQHMPMFHMEHCVFCAFLSDGKDYRDCGRPCDKHRLELVDRVGAKHPVLADAGCRNTVFNALAQTGAEYVDQLLSAGVRRFRVEFVDEDPTVLARTVRMYQRLLRGEVTGNRLWRDLKLRHQLGVTRGASDKVDRSQSAI